ncbi:MAG: LysR family transcriptional regulator [Novosphingobium sp.]|jgi:DNA-binding transcriptional LysR family regulator
MRLRQIEVFHAVYAQGSISAASRALNVSQPAVSKVLRHTETQLGITLFELVRGRLVATDEAHALFREVDEVFGQIASLQAMAANLRNSGAGHLRIGVVPSLGLELAPAAIAAFRSSHPGVTFDIKTLHHSEVLRALYERDCDLVIAYDLPSQPRLLCRQLTTASLVLIARPGTFPAGTTALGIADLAGREVVSVSGSGPIGDRIEAALASAQVTVQEIVSVSTYYVAAALVRSGSGTAIVDQFTARSMVSEGLERIALLPEMRFGVQAAWLEDRPPSQLGLAFIKAVGKVLAS